MLTKEQDKQATRLRDAGVPGDIAVFLASRTTHLHDVVRAPIRFYAADCISWSLESEGWEWWSSFSQAFGSECRARGIK